MAPMTKKLCKNKAHKLRREEKGGKYACDGCKTNGKGLTYICEACDGHFHHECIDFKPNICPVMFEKEKVRYQFKFMSIPPPKKSSKTKKNCPDYRYCEACRMPVKGCLYHCVKTGKDLHPRCAFLDKEIIVPLAADDHVKLVLGKAPVMLNSNISVCCKIRQSAELPAAAAGAAGVNESIPGWCYKSDDGKIRCHVFCMLQIWFKNSTETETTNKSGGPKLLQGLDGNGQQISEKTQKTQDIKYSKKNQGGASGGAVTKVIINGNTGPKLQVPVELGKKDERDSKNKAKTNGNDTQPPELDKEDKRETTQDKYFEKRGGGSEGSRGGASKENGKNAKMQLVKIDRDMQIEHKNSKKKKGGGRGGRKTEFCLKIFEAALSAVISALIGDFSGLAGHAVVQFVNSFI